MSYKAAVIVAHPDDEALWAAGWMLGNATDDFHVICCSTPKRDPIRAEQFHRSCKILGAKESWISEAKDIGGHQLLDLSSLPSLEEYDYVVSHNPIGEYKNPHHVQVYEHVFANVDRPRYAFGYGLEDWDIEIRLPPEQQAKKLAALQCYDYATAVDKKPKWQALVDRYFAGDVQLLGRETYLCS